MNTKYDQRFRLSNRVPPMEPEFSARESALVAPFTLTMLFVIGAVDTTHLVSAGGSGRYALIAALLAISLTVDAPAWRHKGRGNLLAGSLLFCLGLWLCAIWIVALLNSSWSNDTGVYLYIGPVLLLLPFWLARRRNELAPLPTWMPYIAAICFAVVAIWDSLYAPAGLPAYVLSHERIFFAILALALPKTRISLIVKIFTLIAIGASFAHYATATTVIAIVAAAAYYVIRRTNARPAIKVPIVFMFVVLLGWAGSNETVRAQFYEGFGRVDNSQTRLLLWGQAQAVVDSSPVWGGASMWPVTALGYINGRYQEVPLHNSLLSMSVVAGSVAVALFVAALLALLIRDFLSPSDKSTQMFGPAVIAAATTLTVNPILDALASSVALYGIMIAMTLAQRGVSRPYSGKTDVYRISARARRHFPVAVAISSTAH